MEAAAGGFQVGLSCSPMGARGSLRTRSRRRPSSYWSALVVIVIVSAAPVRLPHPLCVRLGRFPVTLYKEQWAKLLDMADEIRAFIKDNEAKLKTKGE